MPYRLAIDCYGIEVPACEDTLNGKHDRGALLYSIVMADAVLFKPSDRFTMPKRKRARPPIKRNNIFVVVSNISKIYFLNRIVSILWNGIGKHYQLSSSDIN